MSNSKLNHFWCKLVLCIDATRIGGGGRKVSFRDVLALFRWRSSSSSSCSAVPPPNMDINLLCFDCVFNNCCFAKYLFGSPTQNTYYRIKKEHLMRSYQARNGALLQKWFPPCQNPSGASVPVSPNESLLSHTCPFKDKKVLLHCWLIGSLQHRLEQQSSSAMCLLIYPFRERATSTQSGVGQALLKRSSGVPITDVLCSQESNAKL